MNPDRRPPRTETMLADLLPEAWKARLREALDAPSFAALDTFLQAEYAAGAPAIHPPRETLFAAFRMTPPEAVRAVILGQDPYHEPHQAHGLAFSVPAGVPLPPSLRNIFREYAADTGFPPPASGDLTTWARRGVLLLNTVLTVREGAAASHRGHGWEEFTDAVISAVDSFDRPLVFLLWGNAAQQKKKLIRRHPVLEAPHPSPLSAHRGFFGSSPFRGINEALVAAGAQEIDWRLPAAATLF